MLASKSSESCTEGEDKVAFGQCLLFGPGDFLEEVKWEFVGCGNGVRFSMRESRERRGAGVRLEYCTCGLRVSSCRSRVTSVMVESGREQVEKVSAQVFYFYFYNWSLLKVHKFLLACWEIVIRGVEQGWNVTAGKSWRACGRGDVIL